MLAAEASYHKHRLCPFVVESLDNLRGNLNRLLDIFERKPFFFAKISHPAVARDKCHLEAVPPSFAASFVERQMDEVLFSSIFPLPRPDDFDFLAAFPPSV